MTDTAKRIGPAAITAITSGSAQTLYTAPAGGTVLRQIRIVNTNGVGGATRSVNVSIGTPDGTAKRIISDVPVYAEDRGEDQGTFIPMLSGEVLLAWATGLGLTATIGHIEG
jgi:hypothetical protein